MEVLNENVAMLSNYEVFKLLETEKLVEHKVTNVATIAYETEKYLERTPCKELSDDKINGFLTEVQHYGFTKAEKLQILNLRPTSIVEIQLIIEELDERLKTEEELERLIAIIEKYIPPQVTNKSSEENNEEEDMNFDEGEALNEE